MNNIIPSDYVRDAASPDAPKSGTRRKLAILVIVVIVIGGLDALFGDQLSLDALAARESRLRAVQHHSPVSMALGATLLYVGITGFSLPGATVLTLAYGWFFGFWLGLLIVSVGSTAGATLAFLLTRYFFHDFVQRRFAQRLETVQAAVDRDGAFYLFTLRLIPVIPFFVINAVMGLTRIKAVTFWWVSQLGMLPATAVYVYTGASVPDLQTLAKQGLGQILSWQLLFAFTLLGCLPLVLRWVLKRVYKRWPEHREDQRQLHDHQSRSSSGPTAPS